MPSSAYASDVNVTGFVTGFVKYFSHYYMKSCVEISYQTYKKPAYGSWNNDKVVLLKNWYYDGMGHEVTCKTPSRYPRSEFLVGPTKSSHLVAKKANDLFLKLHEDKVILRYKITVADFDSNNDVVKNISCHRILLTFQTNRCTIAHQLYSSAPGYVFTRIMTDNYRSFQQQRTQ